MIRLATIAAIAWAAALSAQESGPAIVPDDAPPLAAELPALPLLVKAAGTLDLAGRLALLDQALVLLPQPTPLRGRALCARAATLQQLGRAADARDGFEQCRQLRPDDPQLLVVLAFSALERSRPADAAALVARAAEIDPGALERVPVSAMAGIFRQLRYQRQDGTADRLIERLVTAGYGRDDPEAFSGFVLVAVQSRLAAGDTAGAVRLLPTVLAPTVGVRLLIDRRAEPIWPALERWAGADLAAQRRALREGARASYALDPSPEHRLAYAEALAATGHRGEAVGLLDDWLATPAGTDDAWNRTSAVIKIGRWLAADGRADEGIARMRAALDGPAGHDASGLNIVPNLAIQLLLHARPAEALALLDARTPAAGEVENPAALGYFVALRACALHEVGRAPDAAAELARLRLLYASAAPAVDMAMGCAASSDEAAAYWIQRVTDPVRRDDALIALATARARRERGRPPASLDEAGMRHVLGRADVAQAYARFARDVPPAYLPALDDWQDVPDPDAPATRSANPQA